jgi:hypothetical protein
LRPPLARQTNKYQNSTANVTTGFASPVLVRVVKYSKWLDAGKTDLADRGKESHCAFFSVNNRCGIFQTSPRFFLLGWNRRYNSSHGRTDPGRERTPGR